MMRSNLPSILLMTTLLLYSKMGLFPEVRAMSLKMIEEVTGRPA